MSFHYSIKGKAHYLRAQAQHMHIVTKITLGIGGVILLGSIIAMIVGGSSFADDIAENPDGTEKWTGTSPTTYTGEFYMMAQYSVFVENGSTVDVRVVDTNASNYFESCGEWDDCDSKTLPGYDYVGDIIISNDGTFDIEFSGEGEIMIREQEIPLGGMMALIGGFYGICCSVCVLGLGVIFIFALDDNKSQQIIMMQQPGAFVQPMQQGTIDPHTGQPIMHQVTYPQTGNAQTGMAQPVYNQPTQPVQPTQPAQPGGGFSQSVYNSQDEPKL